MKFSIIGTGFIIPRHVKSIIDIGGEIRDVVNDSRSEDGWRNMVKTTDADCIVVLTPNDLHFEMALASAEQGKIVLCEKPLTIKSEHASILSEKQNIFTVLQLRYHPLVQKLKAEISKKESYEIEIDVAVHRDEKYLNSWKAQKERSGGILFNLGIHYFDLLLYLFDKEEKYSVFNLGDKTGNGEVKGGNFSCRWRISIDERKDNQRRVFKINGIDYNFSSQDNLSYEDLHRFVYQDLLGGRGVTPVEALKSIELVEKLCQSYK